MIRRLAAFAAAFAFLLAAVFGVWALLDGWRPPQGAAQGAVALVLVCAALAAFGERG